MLIERFFFMLSKSAIMLNSARWNVRVRLYCPTLWELSPFYFEKVGPLPIRLSSDVVCCINWAFIYEFVVLFWLHICFFKFLKMVSTSNNFDCPRAPWRPKRTKISEDKDLKWYIDLWKNKFKTLKFYKKNLFPTNFNTNFEHIYATKIFKYFFFYRKLLVIIIFETNS